MSARRLRRGCIGPFLAGSMWRKARTWRFRRGRAIPFPNGFSRIVRLRCFSGERYPRILNRTVQSLSLIRRACLRGPGKLWARRLAIAGLFIPLLMTGCRRKHFPKYPTDFREYAWVTNGGGNSVTAFDLVHMQTAATIAVGDDPTEIAVSRPRNEV